MTSKEALKRIETAFPLNREGKTSVYREYTNSIYPYYEDFDLVMRDLEELERLKAQEKVFKLIKEYEVDVWLLKQCDYENYIRIRRNAMVSIKQITEETFNFLSSVAFSTFTEVTFELEIFNSKIVLSINPAV